MTDGDQHVECILTCGRGGRVSACGRVDVERWLVGQAVILEDLVEGGLVFAAEEDVMMRDLWIFLIHTSVEHDRNGRIYFPREDMLEFGISETDIEMGKVTQRWRKFMQFQIKRTRKLYKEAWQGIAMLEREGQLAIGAASTFYNGILDDIELHDFDVFSRRASLNTWEKVRRIPALWLKVRSL